MLPSHGNDIAAEHGGIGLGQGNILPARNESSQVRRQLNPGQSWLVERRVITNWKEALDQLALPYPSASTPTYETQTPDKNFDKFTGRRDRKGRSTTTESWTAQPGPLTGIPSIAGEPLVAGVN